MAGHRIDMLDIQRIIQLKARGESNRSIGRLLGINRKTVNEYILHLKETGKDFSELSLLDEEAVASLLPQPKVFNKPEAYLELSRMLPEFRRSMRRPGFTYLNIWELHRGKHPEGYGYTQFKEHVQKAFAEQNASMHMEHTLGEKLLIDYAGDHLQMTDKETGEIRHAELFVAVLAVYTVGP